MTTFATGRTLRRGDSGADVRELQQLLQQAGHDPGGVDGSFGPQTEAAVKAFQTARSLTADGIVGPLTRSALAVYQGPPGTGPVPGPGPQAGGMRGMSLHIGLNTVSPSSYPFPVPPLRGCINDANDMATLARSHGITNPAPRLLLDSAATADAVIAAIREAATALQTGDLFFLTYSGHGSQVVDVAGDETDRFDETWVLWDRQLLDDELRALWGQFRSGVRIFLLSDSCHSGTVARDLAPVRLTPYTASRLAMDLEEYARQNLDRLLPNADKTVVPRKISQQVVERLVTTAPARELAAEYANYQITEHRREYVERKQRASRAATPTCSVLLISGCQDDQTSADGTRNGLFTQRLREVMAEGNVTSYTDLHTRILRRMPARQQPNLFWGTDPPNPSFAAQRPLTI